MKTALVTGHRGFVGTHLARRLERDGWHVTGCDINDGPDSTDCRSLFAVDTRRFDLVVHCAAVVGGRLTISGDPLAVAVDLEIDAAMFRWAARTRQPRVVYFSSSAAYPTVLQEHPGRRLAEPDIDPTGWQVGVPDLTYGWAKLTGEILAQYAEADGVAVHVFRPFSGYGPGQAADYPFPAYIARARRADPTFHVWGHGRQARDFVHIDDIVDAVLIAVDGDHRGPLNIGTGRPTTFDELASIAMAAAGYTADIFHDTTKPVGPLWRVADTARLAEVHEPKITIEDGVRQALAA